MRVKKVEVSLGEISFIASKKIALSMVWADNLYHKINYINI